MLDSKPAKSVGHFEESKFSVGGHQFLLECCPKLIKTYNFGQNAVNKSQFINKNEQYCALGCLFSKLPRLFVNFSSAIVIIFYRDALKAFVKWKHTIITAAKSSIRSVDLWDPSLTYYIFRHCYSETGIPESCKIH